ncbi:MAG: ribosome maturation factor RimM [Comamonas sp.]
MLPCLETADLPADAVEVGRIADAWGIKGWFKVLPHSAAPEALFSSKRWYLQPATRGARTFEGTGLLRLREVKEHTDTLVATAHDVPDRATAELLKGARIFVPRTSFPTAAEGEYYWVDLIGLAVFNREGHAFGVVRELLSTGPQTVLVIESEVAEGGTDKGVETLIPFVDAFVDTVDLAARRITVDWQPDY